MQKLKKEAIEVEGRVTTALPNTTFRVQLGLGGKIFAHIGGKMRKHSINIILGDRVQVEISPYDPTRGRPQLITSCGVVRERCSPVGVAPQPLGRF